jgi:hypothetical protein
MNVTLPEYQSVIYQLRFLETINEKDFYDWRTQKGVEFYQDTGQFPYFYDPTKSNRPEELTREITEEEWDKINFEAEFGLLSEEEKKKKIEEWMLSAEEKERFAALIPTASLQYIPEEPTTKPIGEEIERGYQYGTGFGQATWEWQKRHVPEEFREFDIEKPGLLPTAKKGVIPTIGEAILGKEELLPEERAWHLVGVDPDGKEIWMKETPYHIFMGKMPEGDQSEKLLGNLTSDRDKLDEGLNLTKQNITDINTNIDILEASDQNVWLIDTDGDGKKEQFTRDEAVTYLKEQLRDQEAIKRDITTDLGEVNRQINVMTNVGNIGWGVRETKDGGWETFQEDIEKQYEEIYGKGKGKTDIVKMLSPLTAVGEVTRVAGKVLETDMPSYAWHSIIYGDFGMTQLGGEAWSLVTGDPKHKRAAMRDVKWEGVAHEYGKLRTRRLGGTVQMYEMKKYLTSPAAQTVYIVVGTWGIGKAVKPLFAGIKGTKLGTKLTMFATKKLGQPLKGMVIGAVKASKISFKVGAKTYFPVTRGIMYGGLAGFEIYQMGKMWKEDPARAPGRITQHLFRTGLGLAAFYKGYTAGKPMKVPGRPITPTAKVIYQGTTTRPLSTQIRQSLGAVKTTITGKLWKYPRITGQLYRGVGRITDVGRGISTKVGYMAKKVAVGIKVEAKVKAIDLKYWKRRVWHKYPTVRVTTGRLKDIGLRIKTEFKLRPGLKRFKTIVGKKEGVWEEVYPKDFKRWQVLAGRKGKFRELAVQKLESKDVQIMLREIMTHKGAKPDIYQFDFKGKFDVTDAFGDITFVRRGMKVTAKGFTIVEKEIIFYKDIKGKVRMLVRPGRTFTYGAGIVEQPPVGRLVKKEFGKVFDITGVTQEIQTKGLLDVTQPHRPFLFKGVGITKMRTGEITYSVGKGYYRPDWVVGKKTYVTTTEFGQQLKRVTTPIGVVKYKGVDFAKEITEVREAIGGQFVFKARYTPPPGFERGYARIYGDIALIRKDTAPIQTMVATKLPEIGLIKSDIATASLVIGPGDVSRIAQSITVGVPTGVTGAMELPPGIAIIGGKARFVEQVARETFVPVGAVAGILGQKVRTEYKTREILEPITKQDIEKVTKKDIELVAKPVTGLKTKVGMEYDFRPITQTITGQKVEQILQQEQLKLTKPLTAPKLDLDLVSEAVVIPVVTPTVPPPPPPVPPPPIPREDYVEEFVEKIIPKKKIKKVKLKKPIKEAEPIVLAQPFRVMESQIKYGVATHPESTAELFELGRKRGWDIPTVELVEEEIGLRKPKKKIFDWEIGKNVKTTLVKTKKRKKIRFKKKVY